MSIWRQLSRGLRALTARADTDREITDEVQDYFERARQGHLASGLSREDAGRAARQDLGNVTGLKEHVRTYGWENMVESLLADMRYAVRGLRRTPGFTAIVVLTLALGIGGTTAIISALKPILFEPVSYPDAHRIAMIREVNTNGSRNDGTFGMYQWFRERSRTFESVAVMKSWIPAMTSAAAPELLAGQRVSASYFHVLGVSPAFGSQLQESDDVLGGANVVMLSHGLWMRRFAGDSSIVGKTVTLDGIGYQVTGVMPVEFENVLAPATELWGLMQYGMSQGRAWGHHLQTIGRLRPGITVEQASSETDALGHDALDELQPVTYGRDVVFATTSLSDDLTRSVKPMLLIIASAIGLVLVIACVNVTNLLLARGVRRRGEFALRAALGAARARLLRQLLSESMLVAVLGGLAGIVIAVLGVRALVAVSPAGLPRVAAIRVDGTVFAIGALITTLVGLVVGVIPAMQAARNDPQFELKHGLRRSGGAHRRTRSALVVGEVALALVLLVGSGLLLRSLQQWFAIPAGFDSSRLLTLQVQTIGQRFDSTGTTNQFFEQVLGAVRSVPGVTAAAFTNQLPLSGDHDEYGVHFEKWPDEGFSTFRYAVSPEYVQVMRIPLRNGRLLTEGDRSGNLRVALISESLAKRRFPGESPIGQRLHIGPTDGEPYTVVGVVGDLKQLSLAASESDAVYTTASQWSFPDKRMSLVVRTSGEETALVGAIRNAVWSVDKDQPIARVATMKDLLADTAAERRFALILFEAFALSALVLAAAGIYGVLSASVAERTREIGVRSALGAERWSIVALVLRQGLLLTGAGAAIGIVAAVTTSQFLVTLLFGISRLDIVTYLGVIALLGVTAVVACVVPALRAARIDPNTALRAE